MPSASTPRAATRVNVVNSSFLGDAALEEGELESMPFWEKAWVQTLAKVLAGLIVLLVIMLQRAQAADQGLLTPRAPIALLRARSAAAAVRAGGAPARSAGARLRTTGRAGARPGRAGSEARRAGREGMGVER